MGLNIEELFKKFKELAANHDFGKPVDPAIFTDEYVTKQAEDVLITHEKSTKGKGGALIMMGHPVDAPSFGDQSPSTKNVCSNCKELVRSTVIKDKVMELSGGHAHILCLICMMELMNRDKNKPQGYNIHKSI